MPPGEDADDAGPEPHGGGLLDGHGEGRESIRPVGFARPQVGVAGCLGPPDQLAGLSRAAAPAAAAVSVPSGGRPSAGDPYPTRPIEARRPLAV